MKKLGLVPVGFLLLCCEFGCSASTSQPVTEEQNTRQVAFTDVTEEVGLGAFRHVNGAEGNKWYPEQMGSGGGFLDYDGDSWPDVILMGGGSWNPDPSQHPLPVRLYRNNQDGTFTEVTEEAGLTGFTAYSLGVTAADYDNDGDEDFFLANLQENMFFRNDGGKFTEIGKQVGIVNEALWSSSSIFFDADNDRDLDLYVANYVDWEPETDIWCPKGSPHKMYCHPAIYTGVQSRFYRNNGDGTFTDNTSISGFMPTLGKSLCVVDMDFNQDGWTDVAVSNDGEGRLLFRNNKDGTFTDIGVQSGFAFSEHGEACAGMGMDAGVVDSTSLISFFIGHFSEEMVGVFKYAGNEVFIDRSSASKIGYPTLLSLTFGVLLIDFDLDTDLDLLLCNGHVHPDRDGENDRIVYRQPAQIFLNDGRGYFDELKQSSGVLTEPLVARGSAFADYDKDGDEDILITENNGPVHLWRNDVKGNFLRIRVRGTETNRDGLGTRIVAEVNGLKMERRIRTGSGYLSVSEKAATFGLGRSVSVDRLTIYWPRGKSETFENVQGNQEILLVEGSGVLEPQPLPNFRGNTVALQ